MFIQQSALNMSRQVNKMQRSSEYEKTKPCLLQMSSSKYDFIAIDREQKAIRFEEQSWTIVRAVMAEGD